MTVWVKMAAWSEMETRHALGPTGTYASGKTLRDLVRARLRLSLWRFHSAFAED